MDRQFSHVTSSVFHATIALVGNPNVGKSTVFNSLTGLNQHTGNWIGKTVSCAQGQYTYKNQCYSLIDLPGIYSLATHSPEEDVTRDFICFQRLDAIIVVCDATCLERNLNLVLQILELSNQVVLCMNLMDEAHKKKITIDLSRLSSILGIPVIATCAKNATGLEELMQQVHILSSSDTSSSAIKLQYDAPIENALAKLIPLLETLPSFPVPSRFFALKLLEEDQRFLAYLQQYANETSTNVAEITQLVKLCHVDLASQSLGGSSLMDTIATTHITTAEKIASEVISYDTTRTYDRDRLLDRFLIGKYTRFPIMLLLFMLILWITIVGANYPSDLLFNLFAYLEIPLTTLFLRLSVPTSVIELLVQGGYRVLTWVVSVMLPPMAIFFPLFTLLEDVGYLPRIAFNLDHPLKKCHACGKQALTMCMGLGCNAVGVEGCRIIDSPREQLIALLTNSFMPCNGRFPTLILLINLFFISHTFSLSSSLLSTFWLMVAILISLLFTFASSWLLSKTLLKGLPSSFTLELPPYRRPQILKTLVRSLLDRTLSVLRRAIIMAFPTGLLIWLLTNITYHDNTLLHTITNFLHPFATLFGLDGVILTAFILGLPANEIIFPIIMMTYMASNTLLPLGQSTEIQVLLDSNGWTPITALCTFIFFLIHWPCSTTLMTIHKETKSLKWTLVAFLLPTLTGLLICFIIAQLSQLI